MIAVPSTLNPSPTNSNTLLDAIYPSLYLQIRCSGLAGVAGFACVERERRILRFSTMATVPLATSPLSHGILLARTILIVEDEPLIALQLHTALQEAGASLIAATSANEALQLIRRNDVSAAIVDVSLGDRDCYPVCEELSGRRIPFAFHTGHPAANALKRWPEAPVASLSQRPCTPSLSELRR